MSAISEVGKIQKIRTEKLLSEMINDSKFRIFSNNVKNTVIKYEDERILDIYYRGNSIRININPEGVYFQRYLLLLEQRIAYQKSSANPNSTEGAFAFFVDDKDIARAVKLLLDI